MVSRQLPKYFLKLRETAPTGPGVCNGFSSNLKLTLMERRKILPTKTK